MSHSLSPETQQRVQELCRRIRVAQHLDAEIEAELCAHIRDRIAGYLDGSDKLTEDDAVYLAEKHFGDTATIQSLFAHVHHQEFTIGWLRRLLALAAATVAVDIVTRLFLQEVRRLSPTDPYALYRFPLWHAAQALLALLGTFVIWRSLIRWSHQERTPRGPWYRRGGLLAVALTILLPTYAVISQLPVQPLPYDNGPVMSLVTAIIQLFSFLVWSVRGLLWIAWPSRPLVHRPAVWTGAIAWALISWIPLCIYSSTESGADSRNQLLIVQYFAILLVVTALAYICVYEIAQAVWRRSAFLVTSPAAN
jgi:hypothetical protein